MGTGIGGGWRGRAIGPNGGGLIFCSRILCGFGGLFGGGLSGGSCDGDPVSC